MRRHFALLCAATTLAVACRPAVTHDVIELNGPTMGTSWSLKLVPGARGLKEGEIQAFDRLVRDRLGVIEGLMTTWDETSELSRFNAIRTDARFPVSPDTFAVFRAAVALAARRRARRRRDVELARTPAARFRSRCG